MGNIWEYAWSILTEDYFDDGFARIVQQAAAPPYIPPGSTEAPPPPPPPSRGPATIDPAYTNKVLFDSYVAKTPGANGPIAGQDRIITWTYVVANSGGGAYGFCLDYTGVEVSQWSYGLAAPSPLIVKVPDVMTSPDIAGWKAMSLQIDVRYDGNYKPWGDPADTYGCTLPAREEGSSTLALERADGTPAPAGSPAASAPPQDGFYADLGVIRPPATWPSFQVRAVHDFNIIVITIIVTAYVRMTTDADPPTGAASSAPPNIAAIIGGVLHPPC